MILGDFAAVYSPEHISRGQLRFHCEMICFCALHGLLHGHRPHAAVVSDSYVASLSLAQPRNSTYFVVSHLHVFLLLKGL